MAKHEKEHDIVVAVRVRCFGNEDQAIRVAQETIPRVLSVDMHRQVKAVAWAVQGVGDANVHSQGGTQTVMDLLTRSA